MQLAPADLARLLQPPKPRSVPVVFYVGCNAVRTPHLLFNAMYVLDAVGVDYEVLGGPAACCGNHPHQVGRRNRRRRPCDRRDAEALRGLPSPSGC